MVQGKETKTTALVLTVWSIVQSIFITLPIGVGLYRHAPLVARLAYPFFHAGAVHALLNSWCLLSIVFMFNISMRKLLTAYIIAISVPGVLLSAIPVVGMSGVCFALMGMLSMAVERRLYWQCYLWSLILFGLIFPNMAVSVHAYCFALGTVISLLTTPIREIMRIHQEK